MKNFNLSVFASVLVFLFATLLAVPVLTPSAWAAAMEPGKWMITSRMEMTGVPFAMPASTITVCYSKKDIEDKKAVPPAGKKCDMKRYSASGNTVAWKMACKGKNGGLTTTGEMTFTGTSYEGKMTTVMPGGREVVTKISGKRVGDCN